MKMMNFKETSLTSNKRMKMEIKMRYIQIMIRMNHKLRNLIMKKKRALIWIWMLIISTRSRLIKRTLNLKKLYRRLFKRALLQLKIFQLQRVVWKQKILRKSNLFKYMLEQSYMLKECFRMVVQVSRKYLLSYLESQKIQNQKLTNFSLSIIHILPTKMDLDIF